MGEIMKHYGLIPAPS